MRKTLRIIAILLIISSLLVIVSSCGEKEEVPKGMMRIASDFVDYKLYVPDTWYEDLTTGFVSAYAEDKSNISIQTMSLSGVFENSGGYVFYVGTQTYSSIDEYFKNEYSKNLENTFSEYKLLEEYTTNQKFGGSDKCAKYVYTITSSGVDYKFMQIFAINGGNLYIFTFTSNTSTFDSHAEEVSKIVSNFSF